MNVWTELYKKGCKEESEQLPMDILWARRDLGKSNVSEVVAIFSKISGLELTLFLIKRCMISNQIIDYCCPEFEMGV